jgi:electron transfer flavoprotein alpha subunit
VTVTSAVGDASTGPNLASANVIVAVGRGIGGPENLPVFEALSRRLGAALGASRVVVDAGWLPFSHQVGQTGTSVSPDLYLAFGISGAVQHLAGMRGSDRVVAINTDPDAAICRVADVVIIGDAVEVATGLLERLQRTTRVAAGA